eukprot:10805302-Alexandrium_andersonii.AAC.1
MPLKRLCVGLAEEVVLEVLAQDGGLAQDDELPLASCSASSSHPAPYTPSHLLALAMAKCT